ncbi:DNA-binding response regulator [Burkholderia cenocepacia]|uniref:DNA-binding response regulator n=1 Tax=Burkholderia cenocepacia TaxID=95486 RepID=UPI001907BB9E|nr:response regulator transcription factor [Burkholderia cenocepacia]MBJ9697685.1 response regulator transcription factor [Burkholderia cenocepacia]MCA8251607.1 response regulator transcription factor [Burkholderia multivorans]
MSGYLKSIRIAILDDHPISALGMASHLTREVSCEILGKESNISRFLGLLKPGGVDVALIDFLSLSRSAIEIASVKRDCPGVRVIATASSSFELARIASFKSGADGFYGKNEGAEQLVRVVMRVAHGFEDKFDISRGFMCGNQFHGLSKCELEVLLSCLEGISMSEIARMKGRSIKTVSRQKRLAYQKLGIETDFELFKDERVLRLYNLLDGNLMEGVSQ